MTIKQIYDDNRLSIQQTSYTCGPCSILNVLRLKGDDSFTEEQLAKLCGAKPNIGTSNANMIKTIKYVGLKIIEEQSDASVKDIEQYLDSGASVIVNYFDPFSGEGHYAVVTEHDDRAIYLRDCWFGLLRLSKNRFKQFWHNSDSTVFGWYVAIR